MKLLILRDENLNYIIEKIITFEKSDEVEKENQDLHKYIAKFTELFLAKLFCESYIRYISEGRKFTIPLLDLSLSEKELKSLTLISQYHLKDI